MRIGVQLPQYDVPGGSAALGAALADAGRAADDAGVDVLSVMDHFFQLAYIGPAELPMLEGYTTLGFLAAHTSRVELQLMVTGVTYRHPGLLAKTVATLDVLSGGRARLGIGAAWYEREHRGLGVPFPPLRDRFVMLEETLEIVRQMWSDDDGPYVGTRYRLEETLCSPQPLRRVPVMVGGVGERKSLRIVARHADACNIFAGGGSGAEFVAGKLAVLREHCEHEGRAYDDILRTILWTPPVDPTAPGELLDSLGQMAAVGVQEVHLGAPAEFVPFLRALGPVAEAVHAL